MCTRGRLLCQQQLFGDFIWEDSGSEYLDKNQDVHNHKEYLNLLTMTTLAWGLFLLIQCSDSYPHHSYAI